ncbi:hypothetical protein [Chryseobacterium fistulae]|uniref:DUF3037 domain-containing protein n=1 Tax=Chryseobacterium fistulae TaxID=2675058 RepID=A0A6N4XNI7_9FLAO|nr:hypothetical protein [Chryseobacterium fistulae]CAA7386743.1 hypothetical protein CHRY9393_01043 [Chryseobacterium fistulae]
MKTIYSILYIPLNATLGERLSIGILMTNGKDYYFKYSLDKLNAIKGIINTEKIHIIKSYLRALEKEVNFEDDSVLFHKELVNLSNWVNETYLSYLSKYSNNIIQFSNPKIIDIDLNENNFRRLFEKYVYKFDIGLKEDEKNVNVLDTVKKYLYPIIEKNVNIDITLTSLNFKNLFAPIEINFFGVNNVPVAGQTFDFDKKHYYLENDVTRYISLAKALELEGIKNGKYFVLGKEPNKMNKRSHNMWKHIRDSNFLKFIDVDEYEIVEEYIKEHNVRPYFGEERIDKRFIRS